MKKNLVKPGVSVIFKDNGVTKEGRVVGKGNMKATIHTMVPVNGGMVSVNLEVPYKDLISITK